MSRVHHKVFARSLSAAIGFAVMASAAIAVAKPASADALIDMFLDTLNNSGVSYGDANAASSLGKNACAVLKQPGSDFARVASEHRLEQQHHFTRHGRAVHLDCHLDLLPHDVHLTHRWRLAGTVGAARTGMTVRTQPAHSSSIRDL